MDQLGPGLRPCPWARRHSRSPACRPASGSGRPQKKISSWVRPGVCEVRASAFRPVSALIRLDLPTLERPAKAISMPRILRQRFERARRGGEIATAARTEGGRLPARRMRIQMQCSRRIRLGSPLPIVIRREVSFHACFHVLGFNSGFHAASERPVRRARQGGGLGHGPQGQRGRPAEHAAVAGHVQPDAADPGRDRSRRQRAPAGCPARSCSSSPTTRPRSRS